MNYVVLNRRPFEPRPDSMTADNCRIRLFDLASSGSITAKLVAGGAA